MYIFHRLNRVQRTRTATGSLGALSMLRRIEYGKDGFFGAYETICSGFYPLLYLGGYNLTCEGICGVGLRSQNKILGVPGQ